MDNPLTSADIQRVRNALFQIAELERKIEKAKACQIDCADVEERCRHQKGLLQNVNEVYGVDYPTRSKS